MNRKWSNTAANSVQLRCYQKIKVFTQFGFENASYVIMVCNNVYIYIYIYKYVYIYIYIYIK